MRETSAWNCSDEYRGLKEDCEKIIWLKKACEEKQVHLGCVTAVDDNVRKTVEEHQSLRKAAESNI